MTFFTTFVSIQLDILMIGIEQYAKIASGKYGSNWKFGTWQK